MSASTTPATTRWPALRLRDAILLGLAYGLVVGLLDAAQQLLIADFSGTIRAARKTSAHVLWLSPLLTGFLFAAAAPVVLGISALPSWQRRASGAARQWFHAVMGGVAVGLTAAVLGVLHVGSILILALGTAIFLGRVDNARLARAERYTIARLPAALVAVLVIAVAVPVGRNIRDRWRAAHLGDAADAPNVVLLVLDTVRRDRFFRDDGRVIAPELEALAAQSVWYENAWTPSPWSLPSQASILTGLRPSEHGADWPNLMVRDDVRTLAERLVARGYATGGFSGNVAWGTPEYLGRGFIHYEGYGLLADVFRTLAGRAVGPILRFVGVPFVTRGHRAEQLLPAALEFIDRYRERPFFLYICLMDVNRSLYREVRSTPFWSPPPPRSALVAAYDSGLARVDRQVGAFVRALAQRGVLDRTVLVVTSDHGESFGAGYAQDRNPDGHASSLFPEQVRVPLFIRGPGIQAPQRRREHVSLAHIAGTIVRLTGTAPERELRPLPGIIAGDELAETTDTIRASLRYEDRRLDAWIQPPWLMLVDSAEDPPRRDSVRITATVDAKVNNP